MISSAFTNDPDNLLSPEREYTVSEKKLVKLKQGQRENFIHNCLIVDGHVHCSWFPEAEADALKPQLCALLCHCQYPAFFFYGYLFLYCSLSLVKPWQRHRTTFSCCLQVLPFLNSVGIQFLSSFLCIVTYSMLVSSPWASLQVWFLACSKFSLNCSLTVITCFSALTWFGLHSCF